MECTNEVKICPKCLEETANFNKNKKSSDGLEYYCRKCQSVYRKAHYRANKEKYQKAHAEWYKQNKTAHNKTAWRRHLLASYGLSEAEYNTLLASTTICEICAVEFTETPCVDHCHTTGKVRGLLCRKCNKALGLFKDSPEILTKAVQYLNKGSDD